jgi:hypothetical protein
MADFTESQRVKTHDDNEFSTKIVDGQSGDTATHKLSIAKHTDTHVGGTNDYGIPKLVLTDEAAPRLVIPQADTEGNQKVVVVPSADEDHLCSYHKHDSVAQDASDNHDVLVTNAKTAKSIEVTCSSLSLVKYEIGEWDGVSVFTPWAVIYTSPSSPTFHLPICQELLGDGSKAIRVIATNRDRANDAHTTIHYVEE